jgi:hypothetical protein
MHNLPNDPLNVLLEVIYRECPIALCMLSHTNHRMSHIIFIYFPYLQITCHQIASKGYLNILKWAHSNGYHWDYLTCYYATIYDRLDVLEWILENGCEWNQYTYYLAMTKWPEKKWYLIKN